MKRFLTSSAIALSIGVANAQSAPPPTVVTATTPAKVTPVRTHRSRHHRKPVVAPEVARVARANQAATQAPKAEAFLNACPSSEHLAHLAALISGVRASSEG